MGSLTKPPFKETSFSKNYYTKEIAKKPTIARNIGRGIDSYSNNWRVTPSFDLGNWHFIETGKEIRKKRKGQEDKNYCPLIRIYLQSFDISVEGNPHILYDRISLYNFITKAYKVTIFDLPLNKQELNGLMGVIEAFGKEKYTPTPEAEWLKFIKEHIEDLNKKFKKFNGGES
jgi:hypothetical protein